MNFEFYILHLKFYSLLLTLCLSACQLYAQSDPFATCQTQSLYHQLKKLSGDYLLFGHENTTLEGIGWEDLSGFEDDSDCLKAVGDYPAVYGFDFTRGFIFRRHTIRAHERGGIITYSDHMDNFKTRGSSWDVSQNVVSEILDKSTASHRRFVQHLDRVSNFLMGLKDANQDFIPIIYRPFHENSGDWFWWGMPYCTPEEFVKLWRFTIDYLRLTKNIHHVLYAYAPSDPAFRGGFGERYPGDDYVDIIGFDSYEIFAYEIFLIPNCHLVVSFAEEHGKVAALTEFGVNGGIQFAANEEWFTNTFLRPIKEDSIARKLAFALTWRNDRANHHWIPLPGSPNHGSFVDFYKDEFTLFEKDLPNMYDCDQITDIDSIDSEVKSNKFLLKISPNPTTDFLQIRLSDKTQFENFVLLVFDSMGRLTKKASFFSSDFQLDVRNLPKGIYMLKIDHLKEMDSYSTWFQKW